MLFVLDAGNTYTVLGVFPTEDMPENGKQERLPALSNGPLTAHWTVSSARTQTVDEYGVLFRNLFAMSGIDFAAIRGIIVSSVVPPIDSTLREVCERYFHTRPLFIEPGVKTGMPIHYDNPSEVGSDRIVNAVAAYEKFGGPCVVVDFGTATIFDAVSAKGEYMGGIIAPGLGISAEALYARTARLPKVDIRKTARVIGTNTVHSVQSGLYYGYIGLVDGILERVVAETGAQQIIATGSLATMIGGGSRFINHIDELLTLEGMRIIWDRNAQHVRRKAELHKTELQKPAEARKP